MSWMNQIKSPYKAHKGISHNSNPPGRGLRNALPLAPRNHIEVRYSPRNQHWRITRGDAYEHIGITNAKFFKGYNKHAGFLRGEQTLLGFSEDFEKITLTYDKRERLYKGPNGSIIKKARFALCGLEGTVWVLDPIYEEETS